MPTPAGPIYEVTLFVEHAEIAACDEWLREHMLVARQMSYVADCHTIAPEDSEQGRCRRICQYLIAGDEHLDDFLDSTAGEIEAAMAQQFGDTLELQSRVLSEVLLFDRPSGETPNCLNCGAHLRGQYCGHCGQRSRSRLISLWELISDAFGDLFEIDSRLWRTVVPLLARPGRLTHDYLQGRRARYMPPFRMYLVMSVIFFIVAFFDPSEELGLFFEPPATADLESAAGAQEGSGVVIRIGEDGPEELDEDCDIEESDIEGFPDFIARHLSAERLKQVCQQIVADKGKSLSDKVVDNVPTALIALLPLMALVLKILYPLSRRFYVEHLLFFVHFHAFVFLLLTLEILFTRTTTLLHMPELATTMTVVAVSLYIPAYVFIAMRRVYGQGRFVTFFKFVALTSAYITGFGLIISMTYLFAAFSL